MVEYNDLKRKLMNTQANKPILRSSLGRKVGQLFQKFTRTSPRSIDQFTKTRTGTSLLVAIGLTAVIILVSLGVTTIVVSSIRDSANVTGANQAYYFAEGALEQGLLQNQQAPGAGYSTPIVGVTYPCPSGNTNCTQKASFVVNGQQNSILKYNTEVKGYGIPTPGTGSAGVMCDQLNPSIKDDFYYDSTTKQFLLTIPQGTTDIITGSQDASRHPCNWNKINVGETASIPLYYTCTQDDSSNCNPGDPVNIFDANSKLLLRIRTACDNGDIYCDPRPALDWTLKGDTSYNKNDPVVAWQITGSNQSETQTFSLQSIPSFNSNSKVWNPITSIIFDKKINGAATIVNPRFTVLDQGKTGTDLQKCQGTVLQFLLSTIDVTGCSTPNWSIQSLTKPVLKLTVIHTLDNMNNNTAKIPYLEYQIIIDTPKTPPNNSQTVTAEGYSGNFKQVLQVKEPQDSGLLQYVIQQ